MGGAAGGAGEKIRSLKSLRSLRTLTDKRMRVTIAGSGNVAESLARAMSRAGVEVVQVYARNEMRGREVARIAHAQWCGTAKELLPADIVIVAVSDGAVAEVEIGRAHV